MKEEKVEKNANQMESITNATNEQERYENKVSQIILYGK